MSQKEDTSLGPSFSHLGVACAPVFEVVEALLETLGPSFAQRLFTLSIFILKADWPILRASRESESFTVDIPVPRVGTSDNFQKAFLG